MKKKVVYIIGSLRNPNVPIIANKLRKETPHEIFDSWFSPGPHADDFWRKYEKAKGITYKEALNSWAAKHIFEFDTFHINRADIVVMVMPSGKSGHLELGYALGKGKKGYMLFDKEPKRWDVMVQFCTDVFFDLDELIKELNK
jgi:nucleoside 2-deoxyribosyltransferase